MKKDVLHVLQSLCPIQLEESMLERPVHTQLGDLALPCFPFARN